MFSRINIFALCMLGALATPAFVSAQGSKEPTPLLQGGFIQQLRSLPNTALETLEAAENGNFQTSQQSRNATSAAAGERTAKNQTRNSSMPVQPTGRATLRRTHESPWLERMSEARNAQTVPQRTYENPPPQAIQAQQTQPTKQSRQPSQGLHPTQPPKVTQNRQLSPSGQPSPSRQPPPSGQLPLSRQLSPSRQLSDLPADGPDPSRPALLSLSDHPISTSQQRLPEILTSQPALQEFQPSVGPSGNLVPEYRGRVHVETDLPPGLQLSPPTERTISERTTTSQAALGQGRAATGDYEQPTQAALTADSLQQAPRVSRVPLPRPAMAVDGGSAAGVSPPATITPVALPPAALPPVALPPAQRNTTQLPSTQLPSTQLPQPALSAPPAVSSGKLELEPTPRRIEATEASLTPLPSGTRISSASLRSNQVDRTAEGVSVPTQLAQRPLAERLAGSNPPALPSTSLPSTSLPSTSLPVPTLPSTAPLPSSLPAAVQPYAAAVIANSPAGVEQGQKIASGQPPASSELPRLGNSLSSPPSSSRAEVEPSSSRTEDESRSSRAEDESSTANTQRLKMVAPRVQVALNGPADLPIGTPANYEVVVKNDDSIDLEGLMLRLDIPAGVKVQPLKPSHGAFEVETTSDGMTLLTWGFERLPAGQTAMAPVQLIANSAKNFAVAMEWTLVPLSGSAAVAVRAPRLELALEGPSEVVFGQPNVYRLHVRNPGNAPATQVAVQLSAAPYGSSEAQIGAIPPGEEEVIDVELTFNQQGGIDISANAKDDSGLTSKTAIAVIVRQAKIESQLVASDAVYHGTEAECRIRISNIGDADASNLRASVQLPSGANLIAAPSGAKLTGRELVWSIAKLAAASSEEFVLQMHLTGEGANLIEFACSGPGNLATSAQATTLVESITDLKLFVSDPVAPAPVGSEVLYELTLTNRGSKTATNVKVTAQFSEGIEPTRCEGHSARIVPGQTLFDPIPRVGPGETMILKVFAKSAASGTHRFRVEVRSEDSEVRLVQEESTQYLDKASRLAQPNGGVMLR